MNTRLCLKTAGRIDAALLRELGEGIDLARLMAEPLYARDVLLVCDGFGPGELASLAQEYRAATSAAAAEASAAAAAGPDSGGFSASRFFGSLFGGLSPPEQPPPSTSKTRQRGGFGRWGRGG